MTLRPYHSPRRAQAAELTRLKLIEVAGALLAQGIVSMEAVARAAKVTRLTVYKQFGSRRALFEAVFDERALKGGLKRIPEIMMIEDPRIALEKLIEIFCAFYSGDPAIARIHDACAADQELRQAMEERAERRRKVLGVLLERMGEARQDGIDLLFALTTLPVYQSLSAGRSPEQVCDLIKAASFAIISAEERHNSDIKRD